MHIIITTDISAMPCTDLTKGIPRGAELEAPRHPRKLRSIKPEARGERGQGARHQIVDARGHVERVAHGAEGLDVHLQRDKLDTYMSIKEKAHNEEARFQHEQGQA